MPLTACPTSRTMCASCQGESLCRPNIPAMPDQPPINAPKRTRLKGHQKRNRPGIRHGIHLGNRPGNSPKGTLRILLGARTKARAHALMAGLPMAHMAGQIPVQAQGQILGRIPERIPERIPGQMLGLTQGLAPALPAPVVFRSASPLSPLAKAYLNMPNGSSLRQNLNLRTACGSTRPLLPRAIARVAMLTSLFLQGACALTASQNPTQRGTFCLLRVLLWTGVFCRPHRPLLILCSTSRCRWSAR